jgi:hypothetical protein
MSSIHFVGSNRSSKSTHAFNASSSSDAVAAFNLDDSAAGQEEVVRFEMKAQVPLLGS